MTELLAVAVITLLAVISPGPDFAMVTRNSLLHGRRAGLWCAMGIALGVQVHVFYTMFGVAVLMAYAPMLLGAIKLAGAAYLIGIGWKTLTANAMPSGNEPADGPATLATWAALRTGLLTNALNPKTTLFVVSTYTQVVHPGTPQAAQFGYGLFMSAAHAVWFALVATVLTSGTLRHALLARQRLVDRVIGAILIGLGMMLGVARLA
ncbi:LysE family translocator [Ralstonia syzygii]|uniref:Putative amino acid (Threonine) efflux protein n=1 Tax=Ralstonia syzygii R24 TaxID=907261 RepID=G3A8U8_9RALS|nr:LysE family transporter [Ralstonia syzygii]CAH0447663.1 Leucine efflux protein [Ralstonia syzygii subsp. syzygii]CCA87681.1 putative amino acid (threonine) efflux protein [Ralstonia syzygii R24]